MHSILLFAAAIMAASPSAQTAAPNADSDQPSQSDNTTELDVVPTLVCGVLVSEDQKTVDELLKNERSQADSCRVRSLPDGPLFSTQADLSDIA